MIALLISAHAPAADSVRQMLRNVPGAPIEVEWTSRIETALGRIQDAPVEIVLLDVRDSAGGPGDALAVLRAEAPRVPVIVLAGEESEAAVRQGAEDQVILSRTPGPALARCIRYAVARHATRNGTAAAVGRRRGRVLSIWGAKGGVGTTTVALNAAAILGGEGANALAVEWRSFPGSFRHHLGKQQVSGGLGSLLALEAALIDEEQVRSRLSAGKAGLGLLLAPLRAEDPWEITPDRAARIIEAATRMADYVVLDLPAGPSPANAVAVGRSHAVVLVCDRAPDALEAAAASLELLKRWSAGKVPVCAVVVNRVPLAQPVPLNEMAARLDRPIAGVVPPDADGCLLAHKAGAPLVVCRPESAVARSLAELGRRLAMHPIPSCEL